MSDIAPADFSPADVQTSMIIRPNPIQMAVTATILLAWLATITGPMVGLGPVANEDKLSVFNLVMLVVGYYFGSSQGSAAKDAAMNRLSGILGR